MIDENRYVYIKQNKDKYMLLSLYMDNILIVGNDLEFVQTFKDGCHLLLRWKIWGKHFTFLE